MVRPVALSQVLPIREQDRDGTGPTIFRTDPEFDGVPGALPVKGMGPNREHLRAHDLPVQPGFDLDLAPDVDAVEAVPDRGDPILPFHPLGPCVVGGEGDLRRQALGALMPVSHAVNETYHDRSTLLQSLRPPPTKDEDEDKE